MKPSELIQHLGDATKNLKAEEVILGLRVVPNSVIQVTTQDIRELVDFFDDKTNVKESEYNFPIIGD